MKVLLERRQRARCAWVRVKQRPQPLVKGLPEGVAADVLECDDHPKLLRHVGLRHVLQEGVIIFEICCGLALMLCHSRELLGVHIHSKRRILPGVPPLNIYSVGMYVDTQQLAGMAEHQGKAAADLEDDHAFLQDMTQPNVSKELRMVITFKHVSSDTFWKALHERLGPLLDTDPSASGALPAFKQHFHGVKMKKGCEIKLVLDSGGDVTTFIDKSKKGSVNSDALSSALVNVYLGSEPPSPEMKDDFLSSASRLLQTYHTPRLVSETTGVSTEPASDTVKA
eukprot:TRINITY_DN2871_c0_g1_i1.p2 TRINITY_DN2871_c0_g1~~TRINITY_DN2871_c0_g1_i1.p2  ORF type:complete len:282 (-),score=33.59 TRINITY_DN2871_c0_g1_i1:384-1229(-)